MLQVRLLGQFDVRADGKRIVISSRAGQSLLAYLLLTVGAAHRRERLAGLFWPETSDENARHSLRQELWRIRKAIGQQDSASEYILAEEFTITFNPQADCWLDVAQLDRSVSADDPLTDLSNQLALYRGELLPGFYDEWIVFERERVQALFENKMKQLMEALCGEQRWSTVLEWGERWISLGQTPEPAYRALMVAYAALDDRSKVVATYERCQSALDKDLNVEPSVETRMLYEHLLKEEGRPATMTDETLALLRLSALNLHPSSLSLHPSRYGEPPASGEPPFKGLQYFDEGDADLFFGRELLTAKLVQHIRESQFLAVIVGASGSGKSSIVRAGLIPALKNVEPLADGTLPPEGSRDWRFEILTPTAHPLEALAAALTREAESVTVTATLMDDLARDPRSLALYLRRGAHNGHVPHVLLVIDQFEELFTLCRDEFEREAFIDNLLTALTPTPSAASPKVGEGSITLILTIRADFYAHLAQYPELREAVARQQEYIGPMTAEELRRAIEEPAKHGGWNFESGLVDVMLRDVSGEPGALPLLSHALLETWKRRSGRTLTLKGYTDAGGVRGAIAYTAETVYQQLSPEQQTLARNVFLRLTELGEGTEDTRRRATITELMTQPECADQVRAMLNTLADARLITTGEDSAEVAHEALIREWPRLREWLNEDREGLLLHRHLTEAAHDWELLERDPGALYRGARLAQANEWVSTNEQRINELERAFLQASLEQEQREEAEREAQRQRELEAARQLAETQRHANAQLRRRALYLAGAFVLAIGLASAALFFGEQARQKANEVLAANRIAASRELAASAIANLDMDAERSVLLALQAVATTRQVDGTIVPEAENALHRAVLASRTRLTLRGHAGPVLAVAYSPDGKLVATGDITATRIWDSATGKLLQTVPGLFLPNSWQDPNRFATVVRTDQSVTIQSWAADSGQALSAMRLKIPANEFTLAAINPNLNRVAIGYADGTLELYDFPAGNKLLNLIGHTTFISALNFSPDGKLIASASRVPDPALKVWDVNTGKEVMSVPVSTNVVDVTFTPDGTRLLTGDDDNVARVWEIPTGKELFDLYGHANAVQDIAVSPDGARIATASWDRTARVWDAATGRQLFVLSGHEGFLRSIAFSPDGQSLITGSDDKTAKVWDAAPGSEVFSVVTGGRSEPGDMNADGTRLVTGGHAVQVWDISQTFDAHAAGAGLLMTLRNERGNYDVRFSPDGKLIASATTANKGIVWDAATGQQLLTLPIEGVGSNVAFSPDGTRLAMTTEESDNCCTRVWDTKTGEPLLKITGLPAGSAGGIAFTPDEKRLVTGNGDGTVSVLDATTGKMLFTFPAHKNLIWDVRFSPDGKRMLTCSRDATAKVWDVATWNEIFTLQGHTSTVQRCNFSRDGTLIVTAGNDGTAKVWDAATGQELQTFYGSTSAVSDALFSPDGTRVLTFGVDGAIRVYLLRMDDLIALAKSRLTRSLTIEECQQYLHEDQCPLSR